MKTKRQKREEAELRQIEHNALSPKQQLAKIRKQPGKSAKQLKRLKKKSKM